MTLLESLKQGRLISDSQFDAIYSKDIRVHSRIHFTPVKVALKVREWLGPDKGIRLLDVGSGCGKLCLILASGGYGQYSGIEQRFRLVEAAREAALQLGLRNVQFTCGRMEEFDWSSFNVFYFFNPFYERIARRKGMDEQTPPHAALYFEHLKTVREKLAQTKGGTRVFTYHGMGGHLSSDWTLVRSEPIHTDELQLWIKD